MKRIVEWMHFCECIAWRRKNRLYLKCLLNSTQNMDFHWWFLTQFFFRYFTLFSKAFSQCIYIFLIRNICINELANVSQLSFTATQYSSDCARSLAHSLNAIQLVWWMQFRCIDCCCCGWLLYRFQIDTVRL